MLKEPPDAETVLGAPLCPASADVECPIISPKAKRLSKVNCISLDFLIVQLLSS
jgi:hypothetical protein